MSDVDSMIGAFFPTPIEDYIERLYERVKGMECTKLKRLHVLFIDNFNFHGSKFLLRSL